MMSDFEALKSKLMAQACSNFQEKIENTDFEKPPEEETFKENAATEEAVRKALETEAQRTKMAQYAMNGSYTVSETPRYSSEHSGSRYKSEPKSESGSENAYSWGRSYSGYGSTYSTTKTESADALKKKAAKQKVEKRLDQVSDKLDTSKESKNIFELAAQHEKEHAIEKMKMYSPKEYESYVQKSRLKSDMSKGILNVVKGILENLNIIGEE